MGGPEDEEGDRALREDVARAETALRESEQRFRMVVQGAPDGVAILRGPVILYLNPRAARLLGAKTPEDGCGRPITDFLHPDDIAAAADRIGRLMRSGQPLDGAYEYRSRSLDGRELTVEISAIPIDFDGGRALHDHAKALLGFTQRRLGPRYVFAKGAIAFLILGSAHGEI